MHNPIYGVGGSSHCAGHTLLKQKPRPLDGFFGLAELQVDVASLPNRLPDSPGEAASLILSVYARAVNTVAEAASGRVPVIAGLISLATSAAIAMGIEAASAGADALLCAVPPYVKPTQEGIIAHICAIAHATDLPIVLYDVPSRSGVAIADDTVSISFRRPI